MATTNPVGPMATTAVASTPSSVEAFKEQIQGLNKQFDLISYVKPEVNTEWGKQILTAMNSLAAISRQEPARLKELKKEITTLFMNLGHFYYGGHMPATRAAFMASYYLLGNHVDHPNLRTIYETCFKETTLEGIANSFENLKLEFNEKPLTAPTDLKDKFLFASAIRWLGHAVQNIKADRMQLLQDLNFVYEPSLQAFDELRKQNIDPVIARNADWEHGQLCYNADRKLYELAHPVKDDDLKGKVDSYKHQITILERYKPYVEREGKTRRGAELQSQLYNMRALLLSEISSLESKIPELKRTPEDAEATRKECADLIKKALDLAYSDPNFNHHLRGNYTNNLVHFTPTVEEKEALIKRATDYAAKQDFNNYYHASYYLTAVKFYISQNKLDLAGQFLKTAEFINAKYPQQSLDLQKIAAALREKIKPS